MQPRITALLSRPSPKFQCLIRSSQKLPYSTAQSQGLERPPSKSSSSDARWLGDIKKRIGKCVIFGMSREQTQKAAGILKILGEEWRELVAGREGFLTDVKSAGLRRHKVVWGEMDSMKHVNNVTYVRYAESARTQWARNYAVHHDPSNRHRWANLLAPHGDGLILRSIRTDYKFPMTWPDHISVFHKLRSLPKPSDTSFLLDVMILSELHQRPAARCIEENVTYSYKVGRKIEIPPFMMDAFTKTWERQEEVMRRVADRCRVVEELVEEIEHGTWAKEGAVEDMGSAP